ncbi:MAG: MazG nucleotide pyrophosphohydrolase domain-containing protein [Gemmataceae bacterium]
MTLTELQARIRELFGAKDARRGVEGTFMWFMEEVGELAASLRDRNDPDNLALEFADVLAWLATLGEHRRRRP